MIRQDLHNALDYVRGVSPIANTDDTNLVSQIIDMRDYQAFEWVIMTGTLAATAGTWTAKLEESDNSDMSSSNEVADADLLGTEAAASFDQSADNAVKSLGYKGIKRYIRLTLTVATNDASAPVAVLGIGRKHLRGSV